MILLLQAMCSDGSLYSWGLGECGELGRHAPPMKIKIGDEMEYDTANVLQFHLTPGKMYISKQGVVLSGTTGKPNNDSQLVAVKDVKAFGCGAYHSMVAVVGDLVYACGLNNYGQLGLGGDDTSAQDYLVPVPALRNKGIIALHGGMHHSLVLSSTGRMLTFGRGDSGQLGSSAASTKSAGDFSSTPVSILSPVC